jgi:hypothetical protein
MEKYHRYIFIDDHEFYKNLLLKRKGKGYGENKEMLRI